MITESILSRLFARLYPTKIFTALYLLIPRHCARFLFLFLNRKRRYFHGTRIPIRSYSENFYIQFITTRKPTLTKLRYR